VPACALKCVFSYWYLLDDFFTNDFFLGEGRIRRRTSKSDCSFSSESSSLAESSATGVTCQWARFTPEWTCHTSLNTSLNMSQNTPRFTAHTLSEHVILHWPCYISHLTEYETETWIGHIWLNMLHFTPHWIQNGSLNMPHFTECDSLHRTWSRFTEHITLI